MAIIETSHDSAGAVTKVETTHEGRVVKVRTFTANRNHSDTLDFTDFRSTVVTEALVWVGREAPKWEWVPQNDESNPIVPVEPANRFKWVDCTNIWDYRTPTRTPSVDFIALAIPQLMEDLVAWIAIQDEKEQAQKAAAIAYEAELLKAQEDRARNRVEVGKKMVVTKGRKVAKGTQGTVAYVRDGRALLKPDAGWQDRSVNGQWVPEEYLAAR